MQASEYERSSVGDLIRRLFSNFSALIETEVQLAKEEAQETVAVTRRAAVLLAAGGAVALVGAAWLVGAGVFLLARSLPDWLAALIAAVVLLIVGVVLALVGKGQLQTKPFERTRRTLQEDVEWAKHRMI